MGQPVSDFCTPPAVLVAAVTCLLVDFLRRPRSASLSLSRQLTAYAFHRTVGLLAAFQRRQMERDSRNFMEVGSAESRRVGVTPRLTQLGVCIIRRFIW